MGRQQECKSCFERYPQSELYYVFWDEPNSLGCHVDNSSVPKCFECIEVLSDEEENCRGRVIGYLTKLQREDYFKNVTSDEYKALIEKGAVVFKDDKQYEAMNNLTRMFYGSVKDRKISTLKETVLQNTPLGSNPHRVWSNIYSDEPKSRNNETNKYNAMCSPLLTRISSKLVPHRFYALMAHRNYIGRIEQTNKRLFEGNVSIRQHYVDSLRKLEDVLCLEKVNVLARGPKADSCQTPHIDGNSFKLLLLLVDYTAGNGLYEFKYLPGSHDIENVQKFQHEKFPLELMETINAKEGSVIAFFEKTIHGGGRGGSNPRNDGDRSNSDLNYEPADRIIHNQYIEGVEWFKGNEHTLPTDVSFQLALRYGSMTDCSNVPNRTNTWMMGSTEDDGNGITKVEEELKECMNNGLNELRKLDKVYINSIAFGRRVSPRKKLKY